MNYFIIFEFLHSQLVDTLNCRNQTSINYLKAHGNFHFTFAHGFQWLIFCSLKVDVNYSLNQL